MSSQLSRRWTAYLRILVALLVCAYVIVAANPGALAAMRQTPDRLSPADVIKAVRSGDSEDSIIARLRRIAHPYSLAPDEVEELKGQGVTDNVIKYLLDPSLPPPQPPAPPPVTAPVGPPPPPPAPLPPPVVYPDDALSGKVPREPGLYFVKNLELAGIQIKTLLAASQGKGVTSFLTFGKLNGSPAGHLVGAHAEIALEAFPAIFYLRLAEPVKIEEVALFVLKIKGDGRELEFAEDKEGKPKLKVEDARQFDAVLVGPRLYKVTLLKKMNKGEYFFYLIGSMEPPKNILGKGYDFGVK